MLDNEYTEKIVVSEDKEVGAVDILSVPRSRNVYSRMLPCKEPTIFVVDESVEGYCDEEFINLMENSNAYFVIITRKELKYESVDKIGKSVTKHLSYSTNEIYSIKSTIQGTHYENSFSAVYENTNGDKKINYIISEDENSGLTIYKHCFKVDGCSSNGNSNMIRTVKAFDESHRIDGIVAIFVDAAAYGDYIRALLTVVSNSKNTYVIYLPESVEWLLLKCIPSNVYLCNFNQDILGRSYLYCDAEAFKNVVQDYSGNLPKSIETWEQLYTNYLIYVSNKNKGSNYSKSKTVPFLYLSYSKEIKDFIVNNL
jgi:hypothetical protein